MSHHDYAYDMNRIIYKANEQGNGHLESYALQLDNIIAESKHTPELENLLNKTIEFLYGVVEG